jgi:hypothetical protein
MRQPTRRLPDPAFRAEDGGVAYTFPRPAALQKVNTPALPEGNKPWHDGRCPRTASWPAVRGRDQAIPRLYTMPGHLALPDPGYLT